jgi:transcription initiation factor TFIIIB Brf1 subunit/transcription initiation factor TFIIB
MRYRKRTEVPVSTDKLKNKKPKLSPIDYAERFAAEKKLQQRRYCDAFDLWRDCGHKLCRRHRRCRGDADACLAKAIALNRVPHRVQWRTRQDILKVTPFNIGAPERAARQCMPIDFYLKRRSG